jgi:hypothetical protein
MLVAYALTVAENCQNQDVQDVFLISIFSEIVFCLNQDFQDLRMYRMFY